MKLLSNLLKLKKKKVSIFHTDDSYRILSYVSKDGKIIEKIWNGTNLKAPVRVLSKDKSIYLFKSEVSEYSNIKYTVKSGERFFRYKTKEEILKYRESLLKLGWANNVQDCNKRYNNFREYLEVGISQINKKSITLDMKK